MIIVFGSINMDMVFRTGRLPAPGETLLCPDYEITSGGKGANQALAASRFGDKVALVGCAGDDGPALRMLRNLKRNGVMTSGVAESADLPTGCAVIIVGDDGENQVVVAAGANAAAKADQIPDEILLPANIVLMQMELTPQENWALIDRASARGCRTILNLAPAIRIPLSTLKKLDYLIVNELEAGQMAGMMGLKVEKDALKLAAALSQQGELHAVVTLGAQGCVACSKKGELITVPALSIDPVIDTTGAGDAFCGTFTGAIHKGLGLVQALQMASVAGALCCQKKGAQESYVYLGDIETHLPRLGAVIRH